MINILLIMPPNIGDTVMASGILAYIIEKYAEQKPNIWIATKPWISDLFREAPFVNIYEFDIPPVYQNKKKFFLSYPFEKIMASIRKRIALLKLACASIRLDWDIVIDLSTKPSRFSRFLGGKMRCDFYNYRKVVGKEMAQKVKYMHSAYRYAQIAGIPDIHMPALWLSHTDRAQAAKLLPSYRNILAIGPTASLARKEWPIAHYMEFIQTVRAKGSFLEDSYVFLTGSLQDKERCAPLLESVPKNRLINGFGMPLGLTASILEHCKIFIGSDSGLMHIAAALKTLTLGLFGPTNEERYAPFGLRAHTVRYDESYDHALARAKKEGFSAKHSNKFMQDLSPSFVAQTVENIIREDSKLIPLVRR